MRKSYPAYVEVDRSRRQQRELGRQIGRMVRRNQGRGFVFENKHNFSRPGWFRLPIEKGRRQVWRGVFSGAGSPVKLFDYIAAGGARWIGGRESAAPFALARQVVYLLAVAMIIAWLAFRHIPPP